MASLSKFALWCVLGLMFTFTVLVYISPSKQSSQTVLSINKENEITEFGKAQSFEIHSRDRATPDDTVQRHVSIAASPSELPQRDTQLFRLNQSFDEEMDFMRKQSAVHKHRRAVVDSVCKKYHPNPESDVAKHPPWNILVDEKYKIMYCYVQKVACTNWKKVFLVLSGQYNNTDTIPQFFTNRQGGKMLKSLSDYTESQRRTILRDYTKFMFARHPFSRVLSAYRNKLAPDSTFARAQKWQKRVGQKIIKRYRPAADRAESQNKSQQKYDLSFDEFVKFVINGRKGFKGGNKHWRDLHVSCLPCLINYDVIGKMETIAEDARYILTLTGAKAAVSFPSAQGSSPTNSSDPDLIQKYFGNLPSEDITQLYKRYLIDFLMFDYHATVDGVLDVR
ncbi:carbohydrate sulfotransferase 11-like [Diadema setosum]|uniref:carbohydrate sulfotransferase 11-like n=1 Tax=Diadema setosum TaxID=31175 RepID=UPI003B3AD163